MARKKSRSKRSQPKRRENPRLRKALTPPKREMDVGMLILTVVAVVAAVALVLVVTDGTPTGQYSKNVPPNMCDQYCPAGSYGVPSGAHGRISFCRCFER